MWEKVYDEFQCKTIKGIFTWTNKGTIKLTDNAVLILFDDDSQIIISVPKGEEAMRP